MNEREQAAASHANAATTADADNRPNILDTVISNTTSKQSIANSAAQFLGVPPHKVCALLRNVWKTSKGQPDLTDDEMFVGMSMIARYGLDPIAKEVYVTRSSKGLMTIIGIDGFIKILDRTDGFDGFEQEIGWTGEGKDKDIEWVETRVFSKLRSHPTVYRAFACEYSKLSGMVAKLIPWHMLRLFSLRHATRLFTPIGGTVMTGEESRWINEAKCEDSATPVSDGLTPRLAPPKPEPPKVEAAEPEHETEPADLPDQESLVAEYMMDIGTADTILDVAPIEAHAAENDGLTDESKAKISKWCEERIAGIRSQRGDRSK